MTRRRLVDLACDTMLATSPIWLPLLIWWLRNNGS